MLWLLFLAAMNCQILFTIDVIRDLTGAYARAPVMATQWPKVDAIDRNYAGADVRTGDRIVAVNGNSRPTRSDLVGAVRTTRPGGTLRLTLARGGAVHEVSFRLQPLTPRTNPLFWTFAMVSWIAMPWLCILLGFWVAMQKVRDNRAWLLLGVLLGISQVNRPQILDPLAWPSTAGVAAFFYYNAAALAWPVCMLLFGFYFPQRWRLDRSAPWFKWLLIAPLLAVGGWAVVVDAFRGLYAGDSPVAPVPGSNGLLTIPIMISIAFFFISLSDKYRREGLAADERRRIRILYTGATAALTPSFLLFLVTLIFFHRAPDDRDDVWLVISIMAMAIFPLTMAYVIVVHRAMDVRIMIRQGVQYALAQRGVRVIQGGLIVAVVLTAVALLDNPHLSRPNRFTLVAIGVAVALRIRVLGERLRVWVDRRFFREAYNAEQILSELSEQVRSILDSHTLLETVARKISESLHVERIAVLLEQGSVFRPALALGYAAPPEVAIPAELPAVDTLRQKRTAVAVNSFAADSELRRLDSQLLLPLASRKELLGFISLGPKRSEEPYTPSDEGLLRTVAAQTGMALENARLSEAFAAEAAQRELLNREIEIAREVQQRLFPQTLPEIPALEYAGHCRPARGVGGDYYDFLALANGRLGIAIGDVSGKGVPAALLMASLQASVRGQSQSEPGRVAELMSKVNRLVCDATPDNRYATFFYGQFDPAARRLVYTNGGHNPPMLLRGESVIRLETGGPPVGLFQFSQYVQEEVQLEAGDLLVFFTDGISEAENPAQEEWGEDALIATARAADGECPAAMIQRVMDAADCFAAGAPQHDDMTVVVARVV